MTSRHGSIFPLFAAVLLGTGTGAARYASIAPDDGGAAVTATAPADVPVDSRPGESDKAPDDASKSPSEAPPASKPAVEEDGAPEAQASESTEAASQPARVEKVETAKFEMFIPSVLKLGKAAKDSRTAELLEAARGLIPTPDATTDDESVDLQSLVKLFEQVLTWPDTAIVFATYSQDRDGRPRWALRVDWPVDDLVERVRALLADEAAAKVLGDIRLMQSDDEPWRLELDGMVLAFIQGDRDASAIVATVDMRRPVDAFGEKESRKRNKKDTLVFCRLNLAAEGEDAGNPIFSQIAGVESIDYELQMQKNGSWREMFRVQWNALIGTMAKAVLQKIRTPFECPEQSYACAVLNLGAMGGGFADSMTGFSAGTLATRLSGEMAFTMMPGTGFLPIPDTFYQFRTARRDSVVKAIRAQIKEDDARRKQDDRRPAWRETWVDGELAFWRDPTADGAGGLRAATMRTIVFFDPPLTVETAADSDEGDTEPSESTEEADAGDGNESDEAADADNAENEDEEDAIDYRVIIATTSTWADDAILNYRSGMKSTLRMPSAKAIDWQARISWRHAYELAFPYVAIMSGMSDDTAPPPSPKELSRTLADSRIDMKIGFGGFYARHKGPVPVGAIYVPTVAAMTLTASVDPSSEIARERVACRRLRVLHHHARLFRDDYGRWPATVAELDGYVDFASHPELLRLREKKVGVMGSFASMFTISKDADAPAQATDEYELDDAIDDSLYEIEWAADPGEWRLQLRRGEFVNYETIAIDGHGELHRIAKPKHEEEVARSGDATRDNESSPKS